MVLKENAPSDGSIFCLERIKNEKSTRCHPEPVEGGLYSEPEVRLSIERLLRRTLVRPEIHMIIPQLLSFMTLVLIFIAKF